jgi:hypothetical protein
MRVISANVREYLVYGAIGRSQHTSNAHAIAPVQWVPYHRTVCDRNKSFRKLLRIRSEGVKRNSRPAKDKRLEPSRGHWNGVRHCS